MAFGWGGVIEGVISVFRGSQELREVREEGKISIEKAKVEGEISRINAQAKAADSYDVEALRQQQHSWKDEWLLIVMTLPFIGSFIPVVQDYVQVGWDYVGKAPDWFTLFFGGIIASVYGLRWLAGNRSSK